MHPKNARPGPFAIVLLVALIGCNDQSTLFLSPPIRATTTVAATTTPSLTPVPSPVSPTKVSPISTPSLSTPRQSVCWPSRVWSPLEDICEQYPARQWLKTEYVWDVDVSPNGGMLAVVGNGNLDLYRITPFEQMRTLGVSTGDIWQAAYSPDGAILASGTRGGAVILWDVATGELMRILDDQAETTQNLVFLAGGALLAATEEYGTAILWDVATGEKVHFDVMVHSSAAFSPDGATLAAGTSDGTIALWNVDEVVAR